MANRGCGCKSPTNTRFTSAGYVEQSFDGGLTWERLINDPRFNAPIFPPLVGPPGPDLPCAGAKSGREVFRLLVAEIKANQAIWEAVATFVASLLAFLGTMLPLIGTVVAVLVSTLAILLIAAGKAAFDAQMTDAVLDQFMCILFCNIGPDASFTEAQWQEVKQDIVDQFGGIVEPFLWNNVNTLGPVGLTNICRVFPGLAGDCSACPCGACVDPQLVPGEPGENLQARPDLGAGWWQVKTTLLSSSPVPQYYATIVLGCCLLADYVYTPGMTNAPPGNRVATGCGGTPNHTGNYGLGQCIESVVFRSYEPGIVLFKISECV